MWPFVRRECLVSTAQFLHMWCVELCSVSIGSRLPAVTQTLVLCLSGYISTSETLFFKSFDILFSSHLISFPDTFFQVIFALYVQRSTASNNVCIVCTAVARFGKHRRFPISNHVCIVCAAVARFTNI